MNALLIIDKPPGMTSHDVVQRVRRITGERSVGHLGTLDPMATGVLPLVLGRWTRLAQFYEQAEKDYEGVICFGLATDTYDAEGEPSGESVNAEFSPQQLETALAGFRGEILQTPPPFSAKKINGVPAYKLARKKQDVELKTVTVTVRELVLTELQLQTDTSPLSPRIAHAAAGRRLASARFKASVSSGTYIRSLAHDLGKVLGTGGHLQSLRRTRSAEFTSADAVTLDEFGDRASRGELESCLLPARKVLPQVPSVNVTEDQMAKVRHGNAVNLSEFSNSKLVKVFYGQGELVAIASRVAGTLFQPKIVLCGE